MPEPGELITTQRIFGIDSIVQQLDALGAEFVNLRREVLEKMTSAEEQIAAQGDRIVAAIANVSTDIQNLKEDLANVNTDIQGQVDAGVAARLQSVVDRFGPIADTVEQLAASTEDRPEPSPTP